MSEPLVSVVVPIYNVEKYLDRCVDSIVNQTYKNIEILLIDDGSPDRCPEMCDNWAEKDCRIKVIHKVNAGLGMARNTGIENATGQYIFFFDSDDYVDCTIVEKCVNSAKQHGSDAVFYGRCDVYEDGRVVPRKITPSKVVFGTQEIREELLPGMFTYTMGVGTSCCMKMFDLNSLKKSGIRFVSEREIISEDAYFALEFFSCASSVSIVDENLYYYFKRDVSLSRTYRADRQEKNDIFLKRCLEFIETSKLPCKVAAHVKARYQMYSISAMKQILETQMTTAQKRIELRKILKNKVLRASLDSDCVLLHQGKLKLFYIFLKFRCLFVCEAMLYCKSKKKGA